MNSVYMEEILSVFEHTETLNVSLKNVKLRVAALRLENQGLISRVFEDREAIVYTLNDYSELEAV